jgi:cell division protein FtsI/penicillin-binding protein 2
MAAAIDVGAVGPTTTYDDTGEVTIGPDTIRNSDKKSHGIQTMTEVLDKSLNTGMVFTMRQMGREVMQDYIRKLGFGEKTGVELQGEVKGNLASFEESGEIYAATASFGQGILVTPIQLAAAYNALANQGQYLKPYIVEERRFIDGTVEVTQPSEPVPIFSSKTAATVGAMLVSVVENGHAELAKVDGYYLAGKTGTAQVAKENGRGYDETHTKATFAGYGPVENPQFTMVVMLDRPKTSPWASYTSVPIFAEISDFLLTYLASVPTRTDQ